MTDQAEPELAAETPEVVDLELTGAEMLAVQEATGVPYRLLATEAAHELTHTFALYWIWVNRQEGQAMTFEEVIAARPSVLIERAGFDIAEAARTAKAAANSPGDGNGSTDA